MTKSIRSYPKSERMAVIERRIARKMGGIGTAAAVDAKKAIASGNAKKATDDASQEESE